MKDDGVAVTSFHNLSVGTIDGCWRLGRARVTIVLPHSESDSDGVAFQAYIFNVTFKAILLLWPSLIGGHV